MRIFVTNKLPEHTTVHWHGVPDNTLMMMTGSGQFGPIEMGGMFSVMKIREGMGRDDYSDPRPYQNPNGTVAYEIDAPHSDAPRQVNGNANSQPSEAQPMKGMNMKGMKGMKGM